MAKCPYCFRDGIWIKDPIILPNGAKYKFISDTELVEVSNVEDRIYKGFYQISEPEVQEIQDALKTLEIQNLDIGDRTTFSPLNTSGKFQITGKHIKEMRDSVEKLIESMGITKTEYFNYDEEFNHIIHPNGDKIEWTDPITSSTDLIKFQVKGIHLEDLRHYFNILWEETWDTAFTWSKSIYKEAPSATYENHGWGLVEWYYSQLITEDKNWQTKLSHQRALTGTYPEAFGDSHLDANLTDCWSLSGVSNCDGHYTQITWTAASWNDYRLELLDSIGLKIWQGDPIPVTDLHFIIEGLSVSGSASTTEDIDPIPFCCSTVDDSYKASAYTKFDIALDLGSAGILHYYSMAVDHIAYPVDTSSVKYINLGFGSLGNLDRNLRADYISKWGVEPPVGSTVNDMLITFSVFSRAGHGCRLYDATFCASGAPHKVLHLYYTGSASGSLNFDKIKFRYQTSI